MIRLYEFYLKRLFDLSIALVALPFLAAVIVVVGPLIYLEDRGPVFYSAQRLGKNGKLFRMHKFRSMVVNAPDLRNSDNSTFSSDNDPRLTKIGRFLRKTSIDEIPQLLNVLRGEMSLVGPRPDLPSAIDKYTSAEKEKLSIRPGITGYSQAFYRNSVETAHKFRNDVYYVHNITAKLDFAILIETVRSVTKRRNVYSANEDTPPMLGK